MIRIPRNVKHYAVNTGWEPVMMLINVARINVVILPLEFTGCEEAMGGLIILRSDVTPASWTRVSSSF